MAIFTNLPENDFRNYLEHHGVKGQKWYKRRYQNEDGSLTELGRQHYGVGKARGTKEGSGSSSKLSEARQALKDGPDKFETKWAFLDAVSKDCLPFDAGPSAYMSKEEINKRANSAAKLGIKALAKTGIRDIGDANPADPDSGSKMWFVYEDQTIGMALIADLINQGYSAKECDKLVDVAQLNYDAKYEGKIGSRAEGMIFDLSEYDGGTLRSFAEACESIKKDEEDFSSKASKVPMPKGFQAGKQQDLVVSNGYKDAWVMSKEDQLKNYNMLKDYDDRIKNKELIPVVDTYGDSIIVYDTKKGTYSKYDWYNQHTYQEKNTLDEHFKKDANGKRVGLLEAYEDSDSEYYIKPSRDPKQTKTEAKLANVSDKIDAINDKKQSPKYQKMLEKRAKLEDELGRAEALATIARDKKILYDKNLSFLDKLNIKHAEKLKKQIAKIDHETYKLDASINKLTAKQNRYKKLLDSFENSKSVGELSNKITDAAFKGAPLKEIQKLSGADFDGDTVVYPYKSKGLGGGDQKTMANRIKNLADFKKNPNLDAVRNLPEVESIAKKTDSLRKAYYNELYKELKRPSMDRKAESDAWDAYSKAVDREADALLGKYGDEKYDRIFSVKKAVAFSVKTSPSKESSLLNEYTRALEAYDNNASKSNKSNLDKVTKQMDRHFKNDAATREAMRVAKAKGWDSLTKKQKELLSDANAVSY